MIDLEERVNHMFNPDLRPLVSEAYRCYVSGSARGAIVLTWTPVCADLAGISHAFLYNHPDLRGRIESLRAQAGPVPAPAPPADEQSTLALALTSHMTRLRKQHREEVQALRDACEHARGENLDLRRELARRGRDTPRPQEQGPC